MEDLLLAEARLFNRAADIRVGQGFDVHAFAEGDHLWLGGVRIPHSRTLSGHSDADVVLHAITDALLGAIGAATSARISRRAIRNGGASNSECSCATPRGGSGR